MAFQETEGIDMGVRDILLSAAIVLAAMMAVSDAHAADLVPDRPYRIMNAWRFDQNGQRPVAYINIKNGQFVATPIQPEWQSAWWVLEPVEGTGFFRIRNVWKRDNYYIHTEFGSATASPIRPGWQSAWWELKPVEGTGYYRIRNVWRQDHYLHVQFGHLGSGPTEWGWQSAWWYFEPVKRQSTRENDLTRAPSGSDRVCAVVRCWSSVGASPTRQLGRSSR